jgi:hypothetical protein
MNHSIGAQPQGVRNREPDCFRGFQIDNELVAGWLLDWKIAGPGVPPKDSLDVARRGFDQTAVGR